jgi:hypothetical protein
MRKSFSLNLAAGVLGVGLAAAPSFADVKISDNLSLSGFIDMSATYNSQVFVFPGVVGTADDFNGGFDQFELDFMYKFGDKLTARVDLNSLPSTSGPALALEQGFITYTEGPLAISAGKFLSVSGWEAAEPTGMYQYDYSDAFFYGGYQNGVSVSYTLSPMISLYGSIVDNVWTPPVLGANDLNFDNPGFEAQVTLMPTKEITAKVAYLFENKPASYSAGAPFDEEFNTHLINAWASYVMGPLTAAIEGNYVMNWAGTDDDGYGGLVMANYKLTDVFAVTGRYSMSDLDISGDPTVSGSKASEVTFSPSVTLLSNWFALAEAKYQIEAEELGFAVETTVTF